MKLTATLATIIVAAIAVPAAAHTVTIPHSSGNVRAEYAGEVVVQHRQIGTPAPGGRASTLRCMWTASLAVDRKATNDAGRVASRSFTRENVASGSRPGLCSSNRAAIDREVIAQLGDASDHVALAAQDDHSVLHQELEHLAS